MGEQETVVSARYSRQGARINLIANVASADWMTLWNRCHDLTDDILDESLREISIPVWALFGLSSYLSMYARAGRLRFEPDAETQAILLSALAKRREIEQSPPPLLGERDIAISLERVGFIRTLTPQQARNVASLVRYSSAADFSVPGAGKTTEALAFFALRRQTGSRLLVVAPVNAFAPWEEQIDLCFAPGSLRVVRLAGPLQVIEERLSSKPDVALISYHKFAQDGARRAAAQFISGSNGFLFLDESHKIKRGEDGAWGTAVLSVAHLPAFKLVMSGTPLPNAKADLVAQMRFLHPEADIDDENVDTQIQPIFVRTTKTELGLPPLQRRLVSIPLEPGQRRMYELLSTTLANQIDIAATRRDRLSVRRLGKSVLKLLKFVSNPALLIPDLERDELISLRDVLLDEKSTKLDYAVTRARELASEGRKSIIWSSFVDNVEVISGRLQDLGAEYIHGGVDVGSDEDDTRERRIKQFHEDKHRFVLVANPAAAGEAISLHTVCHNAIYVDRTYNAAQFLQSEDRIHRVGLDPSTVTEIEILIAPQTIDESVNRRLIDKVRVMGDILNDPNLRIDETFEDPDDDEAFGDADLQDFLVHSRGLVS